MACLENAIILSNLEELRDLLAIETVKPKTLLQCMKHPLWVHIQRSVEGVGGSTRLQVHVSQNFDYLPMEWNITFGLGSLETLNT